MKCIFRVSSLACYIVIFLLCFPALSTSEDYNHTKLVYPGSDGMLEYAPDEFGGTIPDYSNAGYSGGGVVLPLVPVKATVSPVTGDAAPVIQAAIDAVSNLPVGDDGFRGTVLIKRGYYELNSPILIKTGGIVLRGEGKSDTGTVLIGMTTPEMKETKNAVSVINSTVLIRIEGDSGIDILADTAVRITDARVPLGARSFNVTSTASLNAGDTVIVRNSINDAYLKDLKAWSDDWTYNRDKWAYEFDRVITSVDGDTVTIDAPLTCPIDERWGGGDVVKYVENRIDHVGIENIRGISEYDQTVTNDEYRMMDRPDYIGETYFSDERHYGMFIALDNVVNAWVRDVTILHFGRSLVIVGENTKWITVQDCESREPVSNVYGGHRFIYSLGGQLALVQRCKSDKGRHSFVVVGNMTTGPNVFLNCEATKIYGSSEPHSNLIVGALYDNVKASIALRYAFNRVPRWLGIWNVLWNCEGLFLCQKPPGAQNFAFGQIGYHVDIFNAQFLDYSFGNGHIESWDEHVSPRSLYLKQLEDRLGKQAIENIGN